MRIARVADATVVMHIHTDAETIVALPANLSEQDILELASLVLSSDEFQKLTDELRNDAQPARRRSAGAAGDVQGAA
jgi:hypothetical protein